MTLDQGIALVSASISFAGLLFVAVQLRNSTDQRKVESLLHIYGINREIITLGFTNRDLFQILHGEKADPIVEQHYLQLWFNQFALIHSFDQRNFFPPDMRESLQRDIRDFMAQTNMQHHWQTHRQYYPGSFQTFMDHLQSSKASAPNKRSPRKSTIRGS